MIQTVRPFTKYVTLATTVTSGIDLVDTAGSSLECNWLKVTTSGAATGNEVDFTVYLSSLPGLVTPTTPNAVVDGGASGFCGLHGKGNGVSPVEIFLDDQDRVSKLQIHNGDTGSVTYAVSYGVIHTANPLRFNERPKGT